MYDTSLSNLMVRDGIIQCHWDDISRVNLVFEDNSTCDIVRIYIAPRQIVCLDKFALVSTIS